MQSNIPSPETSQIRPPKLRALIEIAADTGELKIFPIADSDVEAARIMDGLRFMIEDFRDEQISKS